MLLFRKSDILFFKVLNTNIPIFFFWKKSFLFVVRSLRYSGYLTNTSCGCQVSFFQLIWTTNKKVLFLKKIFGMLVFETLKNQKSDFLNSNTCFCSRLYSMLNILFAKPRRPRLLKDYPSLLSNWIWTTDKTPLNYKHFVMTFYWIQWVLKFYDSIGLWIFIFIFCIWHMNFFIDDAYF